LKNNLGGEKMLKTERLFIRITPELKKKLQEMAKAENRNLSNFIENILLQKIEKESQE
jgi:predicted transcriptional regulator